MRIGWPRQSCGCQSLFTTKHLKNGLSSVSGSLGKQQQHMLFSISGTPFRSKRHRLLSTFDRGYSMSKKFTEVAPCNLSLVFGQPVRWESSKPKQSDLVKARENPYAGLTPAQKVKEAGKDTVYTGVIVLGVGVTALMFYAIGRELLSKESPSGVYGQALKLCKQNTEYNKASIAMAKIIVEEYKLLQSKLARPLTQRPVIAYKKNKSLKDILIIAALGEPIKGYGEMSSRGRRRHVSHAEFDANGVHHMRMKFYIEGPHKKGTVQLEVKQNDKGKYEYRYLFVELEGYPHRRIVLQDNR